MQAYHTQNELSLCTTHSPPKVKCTKFMCNPHKKYGNNVATFYLYNPLLVWFWYLLTYIFILYTS